MNAARTEPVRLYLGGLLAPVLGVLVAYGVIDSTLVPIWIAAGTAILGIPAIEVARGRVTPVDTAGGDYVGEHSRTLDGEDHEPL